MSLLLTESINYIQLLKIYFTCTIKALIIIEAGSVQLALQNNGCITFISAWEEVFCSITDIPYFSVSHEFCQNIYP
jgi:hypothetical protein